jgi:uncharacterized protein (TIGR03067 family)
MATGTSFKQVCPSCEAMVPIRDPGLVGRKIDCPKCKYRFVVEEPADEEDSGDDTPAPKKKGDGKITTKPAAKGAVKGPSKGGPKKKKGDEDDDSPKKKGGTSPVLMMGGVLALAAVVGIGVTLYFMLSGDSKPAASTTPPSTQPAPGGDSAPPPPGGEAAPAPPVLANVTNLLPNDADLVVSYPLDRTLGSTLKIEGLDVEGGFSSERFRANMSFAPDEVNRVISTANFKYDSVFTVLQTKRPYKTDAVKAGLRLSAKDSVKSKTGKSYDVFPIKGDLDSLSNLLLKFNQPRDNLLVHFLDANTMVFADPAAMKKFLEIDAKPEFLTKEPVADAPAAGGAPGVPAAPGVPGAPGAPMGPGGAPMGPGGAMAPPPAAPIGGPGSPMGPGGNPGAPMGPGGNPGAPMGPGGAPAAPAAPEPVAANYMTLDPSLKGLLDRLEVEKPDARTKQKEVTSVVTVVALVAPIKPILTNQMSQELVRREVPFAQRLLVSAAFNNGIGKFRAVGCGLTAFTPSDLNLSIAVEYQSRRDAEAEERSTRTYLPLVLPYLKSALGLTVTTPASATNNGFPGIGPGGNPGMIPPGGNPGAPMGPGGNPGAPMGPGGRPGRPMGPGGSDVSTPPGPGGRPGGPMGPGGNPAFPGGNPGNPGDADVKGDGTLALTLFDRTLVGTLDVQLNAEAAGRIALPTRMAMQWLKSQGDLASTKARYFDLANALTAYSAKGEFPQGTVPRGPNPASDLPYRPDQRLSFYASLLPFLGADYSDWKIDPSRSWDEEPNIVVATRILAPALAHRLPGLSPPVVDYPGKDGAFGATHFVGIAGLGMDAADYGSADPAVAAKLGVFGYDRVTKKSAVKDGLDKTIAMLMVPADHKTPWLAGGGATIRAIDDGDDVNPLAPFVCTVYPAKPGDTSKFVGQRGTLAIMADGKVRFIPATLPAATFRALCTIAGGEKIDKLDLLCPVIENEAERDLKADVVPIAVPDKPAPAKTPAAQDDRKAIQGTWKPVGALPANSSNRYIFSEKEFIMQEGGKDFTFHYRLDPSRNPKHFDLFAPPEKIVDQSKAKTIQAIYELSGDKLRIYYERGEPGMPTPRPKDFTVTAGRNYVLFDLERVK